MQGVLVSLGAAVLVMAFCAPPAPAQAANPASASSTGASTAPSAVPSGQIEPAAAFVAELTKSIDAGKARPNDPVSARLTMDVLAHGRIVAARGTLVVGHVAAATPRSRNVAGARLEIVFEHMVLRDGSAFPLHATIRAIGAPLQLAPPAAGDDASPQVATRQPMGLNEWRRTYATAPPGSRRPANAEGPVEQPGAPGKTVGPALGPGSVGIVGIKGMELTANADASAIRSIHGNLRLSARTQLVLRISDPQRLLESLQKNREGAGLQPGK